MKDQDRKKVQEYIVRLKAKYSKKTCIVCKEHETIDSTTNVCKYCDHFIRETYPEDI